MNEVDVSVVIPTFNRAGGLNRLLGRLLAQDSGEISYEVLVVDNNSTDDTRRQVERAIAADSSGRLRYTFESRQGTSYARNTGVERTSGPIICFLDDDGIPSRSWVRDMKDAFDAHEDLDCIGGRVKAVWQTPPPHWMEQAHTGPIAIQDWPTAAYVDAGRARLCLITANIGFRRRVFARLGGFSPDFRRNEDHEFELRMWRAGMRGLYLPSCEVTVEVPPERLTRRYHRRWRATTGKYHALMRYRDSLGPEGGLLPEEHRGRTFLGVPLFMYREGLQHVSGWTSAAVRGDFKQRLLHDTRLWYCAGFMLGRWRETLFRRSTGSAA